MSSVICFNLDQSKILSSGNELIWQMQTVNLDNVKILFGKRLSLIDGLRDNYTIITTLFCPSLCVSKSSSLISVNNHDRQSSLIINPFPHNNLLTSVGNKPFENTVGKGEIACNKQFLLFPQCFLAVWIYCCHFRQI